MPVDFNRIAAAAAESYLKASQDSPNGETEPEKHHFGGIAAVALGAGLAIAGRVVYKRARSFDLEEAAGRVEDKLSS